MPAPGCDLRRRRYQQVLHTILIFIADFIQDALALFPHERPRQLVTEAHTWNDDEALQKISKAPIIPSEPTGPVRGDAVFHIDDATASKLIYHPTDPAHSEEVLALQLVHAQTTIPVPRVLRVVRDPLAEGYAHMVMDYIPGRRLDLAWPALPLWEKLRIAWVLRSYVRQLRRIRHPRTIVPGPLGPGLEPLHVCVPTIDITHEVGPFADAHALNDHLNRRKSGINDVPVPPRFAALEPYAFVHNDLHMRNIILGNDGRVWVVDWELAGFYPRSFEFTSMAMQCEEHDAYAAPLSFLRCMPFIADPYFDRYRWLAGLIP